jgi:hypothetical protein
MYFRKSPRFKPTKVTLRFYYRKACVSSRLPITINMNPRPTGADLLPGAIFQGTSNVGTSLSPDVVGELDTVIIQTNCTNCI